MLRRPILEIITISRSAKKQWLGRIYAARSRVRRRLTILNGEEVEDSYKYERTYLHSWRISGKRKTAKAKGKNEISVIPRKRVREELLIRVKKRRKQILYKNSNQKPK